MTIDVGEGTYVPFSTAVGRSWDSFDEHRKKDVLEFLGVLYKDSLLGMAHEFKGGLEFVDSSDTFQSGYLQNFTVRRDYVEPMFDLGEGMVVPPSEYQYISYGRENP